ncbi:MAG: hypothetical protein IKF80_00635 [Erysipelotrichaceae bacterium]|nr:hypothetical protein [Erysipelotrichaceae bacterium]
MEKENNTVKDNDLANVSGGTREEIDKIIALFRKYGFENEAKKLEKSGVFFFKDGFDSVMKSLGYTHELTVYAYDDEHNNYNIYNGNRIGNMKFMEILEEFLSRTANGTEWWQ